MVEAGTLKKVLIFAISLVSLLAVHLFGLQVGLAQVSVSVTPAQADVLVNQTQQFVATVSGIEDQRVIWRVIAQGNGTFGPGVIDDTGLYTAPPNAPEPPFVTIEARSVADPMAAGTAAVIVRGVRNYSQSNVDDDLSAYNGRTYINFTWIELPPGTGKFVLSRASSIGGPWTAVLIDEFPNDLTPSGSAEYTNKELILPDTANDYFYKMESFSATNDLLKSYAPVFVPKFVGP